MKSSPSRITRRAFLGRAGASAAGLLVAPYFMSSPILAGEPEAGVLSGTPVALTQGDNYDRTFIKQRIQHLFDSLGGIGDVVKTGDKVAIKINLTGGSGSAGSPALGGVPITESMWTHPEVLRAVGELLIDAGVSGGDITIVEALWDDASYNNFGYKDVQLGLGAKMVNLNAVSPYSAFVSMPVGSNKYNFNSFTVNQVLSDVNVYVSIPKMKEHSEAGVTASLKNQIGMVPRQLYQIPADQGRRAALHSPTGGSSTAHLPRSVCDVNFARPVHLAVIDGIRNARGGEGVWNPMFRTWADHVLLAGKEPVATDSIAAYLMGHNPGAATIALPAGGTCDNYLDLSRQKGVGTNLMADITVVGDGAGLVTSVPQQEQAVLPDRFALYQNYPNPFNPSTTFRFQLPVDAHVTIAVYSMSGKKVGTLADTRCTRGIHEVQWMPVGFASGVYVCELRAGSFRETIKMVYQK